MTRAKAHDGLHAEIAGLHAQLEDLRQSKTVAALGRVAGAASALLRTMADEDKKQGWRSNVGFGDLRSSLAEALRAFAVEFEADLALLRKRSVELEHGPLAAELAAEKDAEDAVCPECHGRSSRSWDPCPRCKGSGQIDPSEAEARDDETVGKPDPFAMDFGSDEGDEGGLRTVPLAPRARAASKLDRQLQEVRVAQWVSESKTMAEALVIGNRPGAGALILSVLSFVVGNHVNDVELLRLSQVLASAGLDALQDRGKEAS